MRISATLLLPKPQDATRVRLMPQFPVQRSVPGNPGVRPSASPGPEIENQPVGGESGSGVPGTNTGSINPNPAPSQDGICISTTWLFQRGLEHAALRHSQTTRVVCIAGLPDIPCGTSGHLLRVCTTDRSSCSLTTYREICTKRSDCVSTTMPVSQLSHTFDWSQFNWNSNEGLIYELTSLSANPNSSKFALSRVVAIVADRLNRVGLGSFCNKVSLVMNTRFNNHPCVVLNINMS